MPEGDKDFICGKCWMIYDDMDCRCPSAQDSKELPTSIREEQLDLFENNKMSEKPW